MGPLVDGLNYYGCGERCQYPGPLPRLADQLRHADRMREDRMIVDAHAYCFPPLGEANGFPSAREHLRYVQREMADHHQPVRRLTDRAPGQNEMLADPRDRTLRGLREVGFRAGGHGRFVWTVDGHEYAKQYLPPALADLAHPPEMLVAQMDYAGVDRALLHTDHVMGEHHDRDASARAGDRRPGWR